MCVCGCGGVCGMMCGGVLGVCRGVCVCLFCLAYAVIDLTVSCR